MAFDGIFLHLIKNEIASKVVGFRVDKIYQPSKEEILFTFRTYDGSEKLLLSAKADSSRIQITNQYIENPKKPPMLTMLLRKLLCGAVLREIKQEGFERILTLVFDAKNDLGDPVEYRLIIEIMGKYSNIILVDKKYKIIECVKRIDETKSSVREILPGLTYKLPPAQNKMNILTDSIPDIEAKMKSLDTTRGKAAGKVIQGISPIVANEIEFDLSLSGLKEHINHPQPTVVILDKPKDFTYFMPHQFGDLCTYKIFDTLSDLVDYFYYEQVRIERIRQRSNDLFHRLNTLKERAVRKSINRRRELDECADKERLKICGDLINANLHRLEKGAMFYDLENYYDNMSPIRIPVDPTLSPAQNAQKYYKNYRKKQIAENKLLDFIKEADEEASYLDTVIDELSRAETDSEITAIRDELRSVGLLSRAGIKNQKQKKLPPKKYISSDGYTIFVGRNNVQNDKLTLKTAKNYDLWFHVKDTPGSHVIVEAVKEKPFTDKLIREAAMLACVNSKAGSSSNVAVDYTIVKNVHKPNGAKPGMVIYDDYKTEYVTPNEEELAEVKEIE